MAGEWIAVDLALPEKPEFQEIMDLTGRDEAWVEFLLIRMWGWASMHCADGTARMTMPRMVRTWGADEAFWRAVAAVGWLEIDETAATVAVPGWDRRFSQAAKARLQHRDRAKAQGEREQDRRAAAGGGCAQAQAQPAPPRSRGEERTFEVPPPPRACTEGDPAANWATLREAWNKGPGRPWTPPEPPDEAVERLSDPAWLPAALTAIDRLRACHYFRTPVPLTQFCGPKFVGKVNQGKYDEIHDNRRPADERQPARLDPMTAKALAATKAREDARRAAEHARLDAEAGEDVEAARAKALRSLRAVT